MTDPTDETQPHPTASSGAGSAPESPSSPIEPPPPPASEPPRSDAPPASAPPLKADPNRPASEWREPPWFPPRERARDRGPSLIAIVIGLGLLAVGIWYFLDRTLGVDMPDLRWSSIWPVILIVLGGLIVLRAVGRR